MTYIQLKIYKSWIVNKNTLLMKTYWKIYEKIKILKFK